MAKTYQTKKGSRFTGEGRLLICQYLAQGFSPGLVVQVLEEEHGIKTTNQNIAQNYVQNRKIQKVVDRLRDRMSDKIMEHPLAQAKIRLGYIMRALNYALKYSTDKLYFSKDSDDLIGKVEKIQVGVIPALIKEAREEIAMITGKQSGSHEVNVHLLQIIKEASNVSSGTQGNRVFPETSVRVDSSVAGHPEVL